MKTINKVTMVVSKILEVAHWIGAAFIGAIAVCSVVASDWLKEILESGVPENGNILKTYGFEVVAADSTGVNMTAVLLFAIGAVIILTLMAMVFRNVYLIIKKTKNATPFNKDNVRMIKEIGIFSIALPVVSVIMSIIVSLVTGVDAIETSVNLDGIVMGLLIFSLTSFFAHGAQLEKDVDGLV